MDFKTKVSELMTLGYKRASARAKIAHDVVLAAIKASGMKDSVTMPTAPTPCRRWYHITSSRGNGTCTTPSSG